MLADEVKEILRELGSQTSAGAIQIVDEVPPEVAETWARPLGGGHFLIFLPAGADGPADEPIEGEAATGDGGEKQPVEAEPLEPSIAEALERSCRALRAAAKRWGATAVPLASWPEGSETPADGRVAERITHYLEAMMTSSQARNVLVTLHGKVVASSAEPLELEGERVPFMLKRVAADGIEREGTSFGEIHGDDFYARSFWVGAVLIAFFEGPWALDFVRHRAKHMCRELSHLLAALEPPPHTPASVAPVPE